MERLFKSFWELEKRIEGSSEYMNEQINLFWETVLKCEDE